MTQDGLFDFYDEGLGLDIANRHFARMAAQVSHRYPHMKVFEIGRNICCLVSISKILIILIKFFRRRNWWIDKTYSPYSWLRVLYIHLYGYFKWVFRRS